MIESLYSDFENIENIQWSPAEWNYIIDHHHRWQFKHGFNNELVFMTLETTSLLKSTHWKLAELEFLQINSFYSLGYFSLNIFDINSKFEQLTHKFNWLYHEEEWISKTLISQVWPIIFLVSKLHIWVVKVFSILITLDGNDEIWHFL